MTYQDTQKSAELGFDLWLVNHMLGYMPEEEFLPTIPGTQIEIHSGRPKRLRVIRNTIRHEFRRWLDRRVWRLFG
jgi:hypothetical protein